MRPSPVLYQLPDSNSERTNENATLPYRSIFAVLTQDSVLIYDTHHDRPLCIARGLHYAGLTDCTWSIDGRQLLVSSSDGYLSILSFDPDEFGQVYTPVKAVAPKLDSSNTQEAVVTKPAPRIPPCDPGQTATIEGRPAKRAKTRITPTLISAPSAVAETGNEEAGNPAMESAAQESQKAQGKDSTEEPKKKKKRIVPTLVSVNP